MKISARFMPVLDAVIRKVVIGSFVDSHKKRHRCHSMAQLDPSFPAAHAAPTGRVHRKIEARNRADDIKRGSCMAAPRSAIGSASYLKSFRNTPACHAR